MARGERERLSDISPFKNIIAVAGVGLVLASCRDDRDRPPVVVEPPSPTSAPTLEVPTPTAEIVPTPTVNIEMVGFGGVEELTPGERGRAESLLQDYTRTARSQDLEGTIFLTRGDQEGEIAAYFADEQGSLWSLVRRDGRRVLEEIPDFFDAAAAWNPNEMRFEYSLDLGVFSFDPQEGLVFAPNGEVVSRWAENDWWNGSWQEDFSRRRDFEIWPTDEDFYVENGVYQLAPATTREVWSQIHPAPGDYLFEADLTISQGDVGILVGDPRERSFYTFQFHDWGGFQIDQVRNNVWQDVNEPEEVAITRGRSFRVKIVRQNNEINLFVNDVEICSLPDRLGGPPEVGLLVGGGSRAQADNFVLWDQRPWVTPPSPEATPTRVPEPLPEPAAEICGVETGVCYPRTERRTGMNPEGHVFPNGLVYRYTFDPDIHFQGMWVISGRIVEVVDYSQGEFIMAVGRGGGNNFNKSKVDAGTAR